MILANAYVEEKSITKDDFTLLLTLLNPIAPHITEELNEMIGNNPIVTYSWPVYDESKMEDSEVKIAVSVNGKLRATINVEKDAEEDTVKSIALENDNIKKHIEGKEIVKIIFVKNKIINIVVK